VKFQSGLGLGVKFYPTQLTNSERALISNIWRGRQKPSLKHDKFLIYEQRVCGKQYRHMLGFYEDSQKETQEKGKILEENAQPAQEESAR